MQKSILKIISCMLIFFTISTYTAYARYYDPLTGRFTTEDTYVGEKTDPLSLNLYTYGQNNPLKYNDPTGHWVQIAWGAIIGAGTTFAFDLFDDGRINSGWRPYVAGTVAGAVTGGLSAWVGAGTFTAAELFWANAMIGSIGA
jgi:RHS repeat-associated protein